MNNYGELLDESTVRFERMLPGPIERVWSFIVDSDKRKKWLCGGDIGAQWVKRVWMPRAEEIVSEVRHQAVSARCDS